MPKTKNISEVSIHYVVAYFAYLFIGWGFYRLLFQFPEEVEEGIIKPIVWLLPLFAIVFQKEKQNLASLGITFKNLFPSIYMALALGAVFVIEGLIINFFKYGNLSFNANVGDKLITISLLISFLTAISEEISFRGYIFARLAMFFNNEILANLISTCLWTLIHVPITIFVLKTDMPTSIVYLSLVFIFGLGSSFIFARSKNIASSVFLHILWQWPIILFR
ncbi:MAG: CPBP family intramembrane glutamic endopeptidase [Patescibacteria group bacterium]